MRSRRSQPGRTVVTGRPRLERSAAGQGRLRPSPTSCSAGDRVRRLTTAGPRGTARRHQLGACLILILLHPAVLVRRRSPLAVFVVTARRGHADVPRLRRGGAADGRVLRRLHRGRLPSGPRGGSRAVLIVLLVIVLFAATPRLHHGHLVSSTLAFGAAMLVAGRCSPADTHWAFEGERAETARRAAADERLRIAQELHDVVAHSMGVIAVQAGVGMHVIDSDAAEAKRSREHLSTSRSTLTELRRLLGVVRDDGAERPRTRRRPDLRDLTRLPRGERRGRPVDVQVTARRRRAAGHRTTAYRIVQEALTNVLAVTPGPARSVDGPTRRRSGLLHIEVTDDGRGRSDGPRVRGHGWSACASVWRSTADARRRAAQAAGSGCAPPLPYGADPSVIRVRGRRRPGPRPQRLHVLLQSAEHRGRRRGGRRDRGGGSCATRAARRRPHGHPHAGDGRHRGDPPHHGRRAPPTRVLILTTFDLDEYVFEALRAGASGFLLKDTPPEDCSRRCASSPPARRCWRRTSPAAHRGLRAPAPARPPRTAPGLDQLTDRGARGAGGRRPGLPTPRSARRSS